MNRPCGHEANPRTFSRLAFALALSMALQLPAAAQAPVPYTLYRGGGYPVALTDETWAMQDQVHGGGYGLGGPYIAQVSLQGFLVGDRVDCTSWRGVSSDSGTFTVAYTGETFTVYDVVIDTNLYSATTQTVVGKWIDPEGNRGVFAGLGYLDYVIGYDCGIFIDQWAFAESTVDPAEILAYLQEQEPENRPPSPPELLNPSEGYTFQPDQTQVFSVRATDPDDDHYVGQIFVKSPGGGSDFEREWPTAPAASTEVATGVAPVPYLPGVGYEWKAHAWDGRLSSPPSTETRTFSVAG